MPQKEIGLIWRMMRRLNPRIRRRFTVGSPAEDMVLVLTTTGRKTGNAHTTPLQFENIAGKYYVAAARGQQADWFQNILANPNVTIQVCGHNLTAHAEAVTDPTQIADFLAYRLERHPAMIGVMLLMHKLPPRPTRAQLEKLAADLALVILHPIE
ncbi:MAG: nitroreductase family deazaflavin-dependent oxidoreductase [Anaerolineales bacterium]|nr:nitroreductase family deazaflavin-dependent oxidoreductase [Anaerolineales bacterium]